MVGRGSYKIYKNVNKITTVGLLNSVFLKFNKTTFVLVFRNTKCVKQFRRLGGGLGERGGIVNYIKQIKMLKMILNTGILCHYFVHVFISLIIQITKLCNIKNPHQHKKNKEFIHTNVDNAKS